MATSWMEINSTNPIFVTFSSHNVLLVIKVPNLPCAIITSCSYNLFLSMECHTTDSPWFSTSVGIYFLFLLHSFHEVIKSLREIWIRSCIFRPWCVLAFEWYVIFYSTTHSLLLHACINLSLDFLLMFVN